MCEAIKVTSRGFAMASLLVIGLFALPASITFGELICEPSSITFSDLNQEHYVKILSSGKSISGRCVKGWSFLADGHTYNHMIKLTPTDEGIKVRPVQLEVGTYDLVLHTTAGKATLLVNAPLDKLPDSIESKAEKEGVDVVAMQRKLGLCTTTKRVNISIEISPRYYVGQSLCLKLDGNPEHDYVWKVNDKVIKEGKGQMQCSYTFEKEGNYKIEVIEKLGAVVLGQAVANTKVVAQ